MIHAVRPSFESCKGSCWKWTIKKERVEISLFFMLLHRLRTVHLGGYYLPLYRSDNYGLAIVSHRDAKERFRVLGKLFHKTRL